MLYPRPEDQARWDAESLAQAEEIKADKARFDAAKKAAELLVKEREKGLNSLKAVSGGKSKGDPNIRGSYPQQEKARETTQPVGRLMENSRKSGNSKPAIGPFNVFQKIN